MAINVRSGKEFMRAIEIVEDYSQQCPKCQSDNISNEDENVDQITCHDCSFQFSESDYMDKVHVIAWLRVKGLLGPAQVIEEMDVQEYEDFLVNHIYN